MNEKLKKYLPIGSVVLLKGAKKKIMITGFCVSSLELPDYTYDYSACLYPEGMVTSEQTIIFNHEQIDIIYAIGYSDDEEKGFK